MFDIQKFFMLCTVPFIFTGCMTTTKVTPIKKNQLNDDQLICIETNPKVRISDFNEQIMNAFAKQNFRAKVIDKNEFSIMNCNYKVTYTARRSWGAGIYVSEIQIKLWNDKNSLLGSADWKQNSSLASARFQTNQEKLDEIVQKLLTD